MAKTYDLIYLDSCVIFDCLMPKSKYYNHVEPLIREAEADNLHIISSVLCRAEVYLVRGRSPKKSAQIIESFFNQEYVHNYAVDERIAMKAVEIRRNANLETADAIHLATAVVLKCQAFLTRDGDGKKAKKGQKKTILELRDDLSAQIEILTPEEFFDYLSSETKQMQLEDQSSDEQDQDEEKE